MVVEIVKPMEAYDPQGVANLDPGVFAMTDNKKQKQMKEQMTIVENHNNLQWHCSLSDKKNNARRNNLKTHSPTEIWQYVSYDSLCLVS